MKTLIHHIELSHTSPYVSGGETSLIEIIRYLSNDDSILQYVYTSETGMNVYKKLLGQDSEKIIFVIIGKKWAEKINEYFAYYLRIIEQFFYLRKFDNDVKNVILSHEEFLPTAIYSFLLKKINKNVKWMAFFHMKSPSIFKGFVGEYTNKYTFPSIRIIRYKLEQWVFFRLTKKNVNKIITVNSCYEDFLNKIYKDTYTLETFGGDIVRDIEYYSGIKMDQENCNERHNKYDLCFLARFHQQKGIFETIDIIKRLRILKPDISLVMMGGGSKKIEKRFFEMVKKEKLENNIIYLGYVMGDEKYSILFKSKIFLFPSYYESFGQSALEAMKCGLPVVAYDLPPFQVFKKGMIKIPILNNRIMAEEIVKLLNNTKYYNEIRDEAIDFSSNFSWDKTGEEIKQLINSII